MKNIYKIFLTTLLIVILSGCEDKLNQVNPNVLTVDEFWTAEADFENGLAATYSGLQFQAIAGGIQADNIMRSDLCGTESWYAIALSATSMDWTDASPYVEDSWSQPYIGIFRANQVIHFLHQPETANIAGFTENEKIEMEAQARFIRAFLYHELVKNYNGAVIQDALAEVDEDLRKEFSEKDLVLSQVIYPDLYFAMNNLRDIWTGEDLGRATSGAATALLGKVYLHEALWDSARKYLGQVIYSGLYDLAFDQMDNFTEEGEHNEESIFEIGFDGSYADGVSVSRVDDVLGIPGSEGNGITQSYCALFAGGYNTNLVTYWLQEMFTVADTINRANVHNQITNPIYHPMEYDVPATRTRSNRTYGSVVLEYGDGNYYGDSLSNVPGQSPGVKLNPNFGQGAKIKKYTNWYKVETEDVTTGGRTGINWRSIRLADVYLMYAEALLSTQNKPAYALDSAIYFVDLVRDRAGTFTIREWETLRSALPIFEDSFFAAQSDKYQLQLINDVTVLRHIKMVERPLELCFEGQRWHDLVRWNMVEEVFAARRAEEINLVAILGSEGANPETIPVPEDGTDPKYYPLYLNEHVRIDFKVPYERLAGGASQYYYYPVPSIEIDANSQF